MSNCVLKASNNLNDLINEDKDADLSTENVLHKISGLTQLLPKSKNRLVAEKNITDSKFLTEIRKI